tara:strand:+ start:531 stop:734 length:204 start_codon:yes stop_codon:yes gene_type:complete
VHPVHEAALGDQVVDARVDFAKGCLRAIMESNSQGRRGTLSTRAEGGSVVGAPVARRTWMSGIDALE